jgi:hypothetical protein
MRGSEPVFRETTKLVTAVRHSMRSDISTHHSLCDNILLGVAYATVLILLPFTVTIDLTGHFLR